MGITLKEYQDYLVENKSLVLATVTENCTPNLRHIGAYNVDGTDIVFQTKKDTAKATEINNNSNVAAIFQHEGQSGLKNITVYGQAELLELDKADKAVELIKERRPQFQYNSELNNIYKIRVQQIKKLDFSLDEKVQLIDVAQLA
ncbi:Pyridoxamine 5'-phosphate oxidase [Pseudobutyrivibrio sp. YE44]|uniref:pyridoxamine 5'-phosphate oxidase family protein n=1 Tax=Pseudobutyrivibrio sp. YE44 TaxID=1520802 RepID=UPI0008828228|nr:pyridoxamine 5'-phosphate oxidase family protein [Pseudobutyrivibrio sp. YE44]SDB14698.1 Pyridoxamine 5'-phosphate oxidase [Pseudobutyrivibrio sp. YE44]